MVRRAANTVNIMGTTTTVTATGWVLGWYIQGNMTNGETMMASFEENAHGFVSSVPLNQIQFQDGLPPVIPTI